MGELTRIYSCGKSMTTEQLVKSIPEEIQIDEWFPEILSSWQPTGVIGGLPRQFPVIPFTEYEILAKLPKLVGKIIVTVSEIVILMMLREVRKGRMDNLELWCGDRQIRVGIKGEMIDMWDGGFFELGFYLRF